jgi:diguanylate cyclase (GGDEF)-like protein
MDHSSAERILASAEAVELARLRRRNAELEVLYGTIRDLTSTLAVPEVLQRLLDRTLQHLDSEIGSIFELESEDRLRLAVSQGLPSDVTHDASVELGHGVTGYVAQSGMSLLVRDVELDSRFRRRNHERYYTHSLVSAPIVLHGHVRGVINVNNKRSREPFRPEDLRLLEAIAGHAAVALGNAHRFEETLRRAQRDALTGLANHGHFWATLEREVDRANRYGRSLGLVMLDVDHFKEFNDRLGHPRGDEALVGVARAVAGRCRAHDLVARYGGEEFAVILPEALLEGALAFAEKIREAVEVESFGPAGREELTVSLGVAVVPLHARTAGELVQRADAELYRAKSLGRNRACAPEA